MGIITTADRKIQESQLLRWGVYAGIILAVIAFLALVYLLLRILWMFFAGLLLTAYVHIQGPVSGQAGAGFFSIPRIEIPVDTGRVYSDGTVIPGCISD